jgi:hypothetical protein
LKLAREVLWVVTMLATMAVAQTQSSPPRIPLWWLTRDTRIEHAKKMREDFVKLANEIPTLSPAEERWLKSEYDDTITASGGHYTKRATMAMNTRSWDVRIARPHVDQILADLGILSMSMADESWLSRDPRNREQEVKDWTDLAALLMDFDFWQSIDDLGKRGVIEKKSLEFLGEFHYETATLWAQQILYEVVLPYLRK